MAKADWDVSGPGDLDIVDEGGSMRCRLAGAKVLLYNGRADLSNCEVVVEHKHGEPSGHPRGVLVLRSDADMQNYYRLQIVGPRTYYVQKMVNGGLVTLVSQASSQPWDAYVLIRFRVDGFQLSVDEYVGEEWVNVISVVDDGSSHVIGRMGIGAVSTVGYHVFFDNVSLGEKQE